VVIENSPQAHTVNSCIRMKTSACCASVRYMHTACTWMPVLQDLATKHGFQVTMETSLRQEMQLMETSLRKDIQHLEITTNHNLMLLKQRMVIKLGSLMVLAIGVMATLVKLL